MEGADQSEFGPTWYSRVTTLPPARAELKFEIDVDVCVIGGGLAGLTVAREVVRRGWSAAPPTLAASHALSGPAALQAAIIRSLAAAVWSHLAGACERPAVMLFRRSRPIRGWSAG